MNQQLSQQELAAFAISERLEIQWRYVGAPGDRWEKDDNYLIPTERIRLDQEIRLAPGALNEWNLPHGVEPHNPDNLTPEQITEGGKYRALAKCEVDGRHRGRGYLEYWDGKKWFSGGFGSEPSTTYRVSITTPLPAVKESLTPQPATGQSKTPRTDAWIFKTRSEYGPNGPENFTESASYSRKLETKLAAALAQRDEARRLLGEAAVIISEAHYPSVKANMAAESLCSQITNHLKTA